MHQPAIQWPAAFAPANSPVFVHNTIEIEASPEKIWYWLCNAASWQQWYSNAAAVRILQPPGNYLQAGAVFKWKTFGAALQSTVLEFVPYERLAWDAKGIGIRAYHAWLIIPGAHGCTVVTEETQHGWACRLGSLLLPGRMYKYHQIWLQGLKRMAEQP